MAMRGSSGLMPVQIPSLRAASGVAPRRPATVGYVNEPAGGNKPPAKVAWSEQHGQPQEELGSRNASVDVYAPRRARPDIYGQGGGAPANIPTIRERELGQPAPGLPRASALGPPGRQQASSSPQFFTVAPPENPAVQAPTNTVPMEHPPQAFGAFAENNRPHNEYHAQQFNSGPSVEVYQPDLQPEPELEPEPFRQDLDTAMNQHVADVAADYGSFGNHFSNSVAYFAGPVDTNDYSVGAREVSMAFDRNHQGQQQQQQQDQQQLSEGHVPRMGHGPRLSGETHERMFDSVSGSLPDETRPGPQNEWARPRGSQMHELIDPWAEDDKQKQKQKQKQSGDQQAGGRRRTRGGKNRNKNKKTNEKLEVGTEGQHAQQRQQQGGLGKTNKAAHAAAPAASAAQSDGGAVASTGSTHANTSRGSRGSGRGSRGKGRGARNESGKKAAGQQTNQTGTQEQLSNPTAHADKSRQDGSTKPRRQRGGRGRNKAGKAAAAAAAAVAANDSTAGGPTSIGLHNSIQGNVGVMHDGTNSGPPPPQAIGPLGSGGRGSAVACFPAGGLSLGLTKDLGMGMGRGPNHQAAPESIAQHWAKPSPERTAAPAPVFGGSAFAFSLVQ